MLHRTISLLAAAFSLCAAPYSARIVAGSDWNGDNGPSRDSLLFQAEGLAADRDGNVYIAEAQAHRVRQITPAGVIRTVAGTGVAGYSGDGGPAAQAQLASPYGLAVDGSGNLFIADLGNRRVRRVTRDGVISTVAADTAFRAPRNLAVDGSGVLYVADFESGSVYRIGSTVAVVAVLKAPAGLALDRNGTLFIGETGTHLVRKLENGVVRTVGTVAAPTGLAFDAAGTLHVADANGGGIFRFPVAGTATPLAIAARDVTASLQTGLLYSTDGTQVRRITSTGNVVIAGAGDPAHGDNGPATEARLNHPAGLALDAAGNLYIADRDNHRIRRVDPRGIITTYAGTGLPGNTGDGGLAIMAALNQPAAISLDDTGTLYIADQGNGRIRRVSPSGIISAAAAMPTPADIFPDVPFQAASIIAGKDGVLYASEAGRGLVWELTPPPSPVTLVSIVNAASLAGPLAPGMLARIDGISLDGVDVRFDGLLAAKAASQVVVIPPEVKPGTVQVDIGTVRVEAAMVESAPALFVAVNEDGTVNAADHAAERGSMLVLYGTGQGVEVLPVRVRFGDYDGEVVYSGSVSGYRGLWQVNARVPSGFFPPGTHALTVAVGSTVSPAFAVQVK